MNLANLSFLDLMNKGYAYKAERDYFYCPVTKVSVSQNELTEDGCYERSGAKVEVRYTASGVRYWAATAQVGSDTRITTTTMEYGKRVCTKIRNAKRFIDMNPDEGTCEKLENEWRSTKEYLNAAFHDYQWPLALETLTQFFWDRFCSIYIEGSKKSPINKTLRAVYNEVIPYFGVFMPDILVGEL